MRTRVSDQLSATITSDSFFLYSGRARPNSGSGLGSPRLDTKIKKIIGKTYQCSDGSRTSMQPGMPCYSGAETVIRPNIDTFCR